MPTRLVTRRVPLQIQRRRPAPLLRAPVLNPAAIKTGSGADRKIMLAGFLTYTYNQANEDDWSNSGPTRIESSFSIKGLNWSIWEDALTTRINARGGTPEDEIIHSGSLVQFRGEAVFDLASMMDLVILAHQPPPAHVREIKARSTAPNGTKVVFGFFNYESINQGPSWQAKTDEWRDLLRQHPLAGAPTSGCDSDGLNAYDCTVIDQFEKFDSNGTPGGQWPDLCVPGASWPANYIACPHDAGRHAGLPANAIPGVVHSWDVDLDSLTAGATDNRNIEDMLTFLDDIYDLPESGGFGYSTAGPAARYHPWTIDGMLVDNLKTTPFKGTSTLDYPSGYTTKYKPAWDLFLQTWADWQAQELTLPGGPYPSRWASGDDWGLWCNYSDEVTNFTPTQIRNRFSEFFFVSGGSSPRTWTEIAEGIERIAANGIRVIMGSIGSFASQQAWSTTTGGVTPGVHGTWASIYNKIKEVEAFDQIFAQAIRQSSTAYVYWQEGWREPR